MPPGPGPADPAAVQKRLVALKYLPADAVSGAWDYETSQAVLAFQAWRDSTGTGWSARRRWPHSRPRPHPNRRRPAPATGSRCTARRAWTLLVDGSSLVLGATIERRAGLRDTGRDVLCVRQEESSWSVPYEVWLPWASYFNGGIALHESDSVPAQPASHGCVRLPSPLAKAAYDFAPVGTPVIVY